MANESRTIGIRELKAHTSAVLREVQQASAEYVITMHGRPIARIEPLTEGNALETTDGMGNARGALPGLPSIEWEEFQAAKKFWEQRALQ